MTENIGTQNMLRDCTTRRLVEPQRHVGTDPLRTKEVGNLLLGAVYRCRQLCLRTKHVDGTLDVVPNMRHNTSLLVITGNSVNY